jgi:sterol desaturase/sphingolipid hydroxylase (fatty acid hydroxylase superfamily)
MIDDSAYGTRDKRGNWKPSALVEYPPVFAWPVRPSGVWKWLLGVPGYLLPWNVLYAAIAFLCWRFATPSLDAMKAFAPGWVLFLLARNAVLTIAFYSAFHLPLYVRRRQGGAFKYNAKWPDRNNPTFLFRSQLWDNIAWSLGSGVVIWTAYEAVTLWAFANGIIPFLDWRLHPIAFALWLLAIPLFRELHFYAVHRLIHWPPVYRAVHRLHHNNVNPGPWSGLAMHPAEHVLYFSGVIVHWIVPSHPIHALFQLIHAGLSPAVGHAGFDRVRIGQGTFQTESYAHYLHHKYFECNYADGAIPLDRWFGTFHDGSGVAHEAMNRRFMARNAGAGRRTT